MTHTEDFEHLLEKENVRAVEWDGEKVIVRVSKKIPEDELHDEDIVNKHVEDFEIEVIDEDDERGKGHYELLSAIEPLDASDSKHRPIPAGVSEGHEDITAGTGSVYPVVVTDPDNGNWGDDVEEGDLVRLSNNHVYAEVNEADYGDNILQPGPHDGGTQEDVVGTLAGYVPIEDGVKVDIAARTTDPDVDVARIHELEGYNTGVFRDSFTEIRGADITKSGRTTQVTTGTIQDISASVNVNVGGDTVVFRDMVISDKMGEGGDSGSPAFLRDSGELFGVLFAGSPYSTIFCKAKNIEPALGVQIGSEGKDPQPPEKDKKTFIDVLLEIIRKLLG